MKILILVTLIFSCMATYSTLSDTPAFSSELRERSVNGSWRVKPASAMYDKGAYTFQLGYGYLLADVMIADAAAKDASTRAQQAKLILERAVKSDPGNAHAWTALAWSHARLGDLVMAQEYLQRSWSLAANNVTLAKSRLSLSSMVFGARFDSLDPSQASLDYIASDLAALERFRPRHAERYRTIIETSGLLGE